MCLVVCSVTIECCIYVLFHKDTYTHIYSDYVYFIIIIIHSHYCVLQYHWMFACYLHVDVNVLGISVHTHLTKRIRLITQKNK